MTTASIAFRHCLAPYVTMGYRVFHPYFNVHLSEKRRGSIKDRSSYIYHSVEASVVMLHVLLNTLARLTADAPVHIENSAMRGTRLWGFDTGAREQGFSPITHELSPTLWKCLGPLVRPSSGRKSRTVEDCVPSAWLMQLPFRAARHALWLVHWGAKVP